MMTLERSGGRSLGRWVGRSVLIECSRAGRPSMAMNGDAPPVFVAVARRLRISAQIIFFQRKVGVGLGKGARACGKSYHFDTREKKRYIDFGAWVGYYVG